MIRTDAEYEAALEQIAEDKANEPRLREHFASQGFTPAQVDDLMEPILTFQQQVEEEVEEYQRLKQGIIDDLTDLQYLGRHLVALRIARGLTQRQLAERMGVHESQVSRDERNEYFNITVQRAARVLKAIGAEIHGKVQLLPAPTAGDQPVHLPA